MIAPCPVCRCRSCWAVPWITQLDRLERGDEMHIGSSAILEQSTAIGFECAIRSVSDQYWAN